MTKNLSEADERAFELFVRQVEWADSHIGSMILVCTMQRGKPKRDLEKVLCWSFGTRGLGLFLETKHYKRYKKFPSDLRPIDKV
jgi:hypothetical protein